MINVMRLTDELQAAGLAVVGVSVEAATRPVVGVATWYARPEGQVRASWSAAPSASDEGTAASIVATHDGSESATAAAESRAARTAAASVFAASNGDPEALPKAIRALALLMLDEINALRAAAVPPLPARTIAQLKTALRNRISAGDADA